MYSTFLTGAVLIQLIVFIQRSLAEQIGQTTLLEDLTPSSISTTVNSIVNDPNLVKKNINYAASTFCNPTLLANWNCQACLRAEESNNMKSITAFGSLNTAYGYVGVNEREKSIYIAFRGTTTDSDRATNADIVQTNYFRVPETGALVHTGFKLDNLALATKYIPIIEGLLARREYSNYTITSVGHSLGGALATLAAIEIKYSQNLDWSRIKLFTYGAPRIGNVDFAQWLNKQPLYASRAVAFNDLVPHLPPVNLTTWSHAQTEFWVDTSNSTRYCNRTKLEDGNCSSSISYLKTSTDQHLNYFNINLDGFATTNC